MNENIKLEEALISEEQADTFAYNVYEDITIFIEQHMKEYSGWFIDRVIKNAGRLAIAVDKLYNIDDYKYEMCNYSIEVIT